MLAGCRDSVACYTLTVYYYRLVSRFQDDDFHSSCRLVRSLLPLCCLNEECFVSTSDRHILRNIVLNKVMFSNACTRQKRRGRSLGNPRAESWLENYRFAPLSGLCRVRHLAVRRRHKSRLPSPTPNLVVFCGCHLRVACRFNSWNF
jgi:hypothetical protein